MGGAGKTQFGCGKVTTTVVAALFAVLWYNFPSHLRRRTPQDPAPSDNANLPVMVHDVVSPETVERLFVAAHEHSPFVTYGSREKVTYEDFLSPSLPINDDGTCPRYGMILPTEPNYNNTRCLLHPRWETGWHMVIWGGALGYKARRSTLLAKFRYFRKTYRYGDDETVPGLNEFFHSPKFKAAAQQAYDDCGIVEPSIIFANVLLPGQELIYHTDVPEFRGADRHTFPQWLLVAMHFSGLFEDYRMRIVTGVWMGSEVEGGKLAYFADENAGPVAPQMKRNSALVLDSDSIYHGVQLIGLGRYDQPIVSGDSTLSYDDGRWVLETPPKPGSTESFERTATRQSYDWQDMRYSVSWKAYCFRDENERDKWRDHSDDITVEEILKRFKIDNPSDRTVFELVKQHIHFPTPNTWIALNYCALLEKLLPDALLGVACD